VAELLLTLCQRVFSGRRGREVSPLFHFMSKEHIMTTPTYAQYLAHAQAKGFQPVKESTFNALIACGFNPITNNFRSALGA